MRWPCTAPVACLGQEKKENRNQFRFKLSFTLFTFIFFFLFFFVFVVVVLLSSFYGFQWHVQHHVVALARVYWYCQKRPNRNAEKDAAATTRRMENRNQTEANAVNRIQATCDSFCERYGGTEDPQPQRDIGADKQQQ